MVFKNEHPDFELSPYTGMTRESWIKADEYLLTGIFNNIHSINDPVVMPRSETQITYPHEGDPIWRYKAEIFEGLARSFFLAAPLIHIDPELTIHGINIRSYYKKQVLEAVTPDAPNYVYSYADMKKLDQIHDPFNTYQQTVETAALVICLWISEKEIWDTYTKQEQDRIAQFLSDYAHTNTVPQNWRLFNMLDLAFLYDHGYEIDEDIMRDHAVNILNYYVGDGWYRDGHSFDYYSCWAFNVYAPIWNQWYGYEKEPYLAHRFEEHSNKLMESYPYFFGRDGHVIMWGRSGIYRNAATSAFDGNMLLEHSKADPGFARRVASGALLQFLTRDDFLINGTPSIGFYGQFDPMVQGYSCAESPLWIGKALLCLHLPADHPFWTAKENEGNWEELGEHETQELVLNGPGIVISNHADTGITEIRTGKVVKDVHDERGIWDYGKVSYNSAFPWEAGLQEDGCSMQYTLEDLTFDKIKKANVTYYGGVKDEVLYRRQFFDYDLHTESHWLSAMNLADIQVPKGILRMDQYRTYQRPLELTLGSYGIPDNTDAEGNSLTTVTQYQEGAFKAIVISGVDHSGQRLSVAMTIMDGWDDLEIVKRQGYNADSEHSLVIRARTKRVKQYGYEPYVLISQVLTATGDVSFTEDELFPIDHIQYTDPQQFGGYGPVMLYLKNKRVITVDYDQIEGHLMA